MSIGDSIRGLARQNAVFLAGNVANSFINFVLIPLYVNVLPTADYGTLVLFEIAIFVMFLCVNSGMDIGLMRQFYFLKDEDERARLVNSLLAFLAAAAAGVVLLSWLARAPLGALISGKPGAGHLVVLAALVASADVFVGFFLSILRIRERAVPFAVFSSLKLLLTLGLAVWLVAGRRMGIEGVLVARLAASGTVLALNLGIQRGYLGRGLSGDLFGKALRYGLPMLPAGLAGYLLMSADRYFLKFTTDEATVGVYSFAYKLSALNDVLLNTPFAIAWAPMRFKIATGADAPAVYSRVITYFVVAGCFTSACLVAMAREAFTLLAPPVYLQGLAVLPLIVLSYFVYGLSYPLNIGIMLKDRTAALPVITGAAAIVNLGLNLALTPRLGMLGAAASTLCSYLVFTASVAWYSHRLYPVPVEWGRACKALLAGVAAASAGLSIQPESLPAAIAVKAALVPGVFLAVALATGLPTEGERRYVWGLFTRGAS